ncbi:bifunctional glycosyltransferase family 2/GtrA family protein [Liquorilactobacillus satsumensis]|uniref:bifunctional glycosyltransferase family 2/GtrA family protein n=1 Tax=Liquorilactobacillus TaxID=2767888 RepID=UPI001E5FCE99|nr:bifunctional glycosyltransferase family 2/GtrA family protein [Liquorilactobacillus satsumensis]MCC7667770.1 glycosyl transferase [Liquorilactobacillus satsumensis]MCP9356877.1 bifunctional glycosyltransferase family 2/GtrA family protein [Liquorilactobacillus satsumensis]MCP9370824.1 bifunctional glycosyltransferase family 2/GtrA family protein [Liquorilactobacillus satsumensis]
MQNINARAKIGIVIPALDPDKELINLIDALLLDKQWFKDIVVVDDGSSKKNTFKEIKRIKSNRIHIVEHVTNGGKGEALKTGFKYLIDNCPKINGIATMDADGQHTVDDLKKCIELFEVDITGMVLGKRDFLESVPMRSKIGNNLTIFLTRVFTGLQISDTQTGLRIIPINYAKKSLTFTGRRYAFEFDMLLQTKRYGVLVYEQPIATIYINGNSGSHFNVVYDSLSIYFRFIKFAFSSFISFLIDIIIFSILLFFMKNSSLDNIIGATLIARLVSAIINYFMNRHWVFAKKGKTTIAKYFILMIFQMFCSAYLTHFILQMFSIDGTNSSLTVASKILADFILFIVSYQVQKKIIFSGGNINGTE